MSATDATPDDAFSKGNDYLYGGPLGLAITVADLTKARTIPAIGLTTVIGFVATSKGGDPLANTTLTFVEYPNTLGTYNVILDSTVVDVIIFGMKKLWLAIKLPGDFWFWKQVPVATDRVTG